MFIEHNFILAFGGLFSGILAGLLGIGGGTVLVPLLLSLGYLYNQAVATSVLAIVMTSISGSFQNWRMGYLQINRAILLGLPAIFTALLGAGIVSRVPNYLLEFGFGVLLLFNIYLSNLRKQLATQNSSEKEILTNPLIARLFTGGAAGLLAGLFGVGGGVILVPLQMLFLGEPIKVAIQTSLGVIVITAIFACIGHAIEGNVLFIEGIILGIGGIIGAQISTRYLPKLPDQVVKISFYSLLVILAIYFFIRAGRSYTSIE